jgi:hypothetical protein
MPTHPNQPSEPLVALRNLHQQATLVLDFDYEDLVRFTLFDVFVSRHRALVDPTREDLSQLRLALPAQASLLASLWACYLSPLLAGHLHPRQESLNALYGITLDRLSHHAFKDDTFVFRPLHIFRRKLASHLDRLVTLLTETDSIRLPDIASLNVVASDYLAYLSFFHDALTAHRHVDQTAQPSPGEASPSPSPPG